MKRYRIEEWLVGDTFVLGLLIGAAVSKSGDPEAVKAELCELVDDLEVQIQNNEACLLCGREAEKV